MSSKVTGLQFIILGVEGQGVTEPMVVDASIDLVLDDLQFLRGLVEFAPVGMPIQVVELGAGGLILLVLGVHFIYFIQWFFIIKYLLVATVRLAYLNNY